MIKQVENLTKLEFAVLLRINLFKLIDCSNFKLTYYLFHCRKISDIDKKPFILEAERLRLNHREAYPDYKWVRKSRTQTEESLTKRNISLIDTSQREETLPRAIRMTREMTARTGKGPPRENEAVKRLSQKRRILSKSKCDTSSLTLVVYQSMPGSHWTARPTASWRKSINKIEHLSAYLFV